MGRSSRKQSLDVWMNGEAVARWTTAPGGLDELSYMPEWLASPLARPLSLSLPLRPGPEPYRGRVVHDYFDNLLPDNDDIRARIQRRFGTGSTEAFDLLEQIGRDCIGAVQLLPAGSPRPEVRAITGRHISDAGIERLLSELPQSPQPDEAGDFRVSLAGAQEKTALLLHRGRWMVPTGATPTTHIFKLPIGESFVDLSSSVENEWLCAQLLRELGLPVAECEPMRFGEQRVLVVKRFDRSLSDDGRWILRRPQEDLAQACGVAADMKYESEAGPGIRQLMELLRGSSDAHADRLRFFRTQVVFWLLCAIDGHAKNFSVFHEAGGGFRLTPAYDVLSAYPVIGRGKGKLVRQKVKMAMAVWGENRHYRWSEIRRRHFEHTAKDCGIAADGVSVLDALVAAVPGAVARVREALPARFPEAVSTPILSGVLAAAKQLVG
ncbi:MAG: type II toxin-antitoxin system HipA family toxin [Myxococcaceae bacterium]|nr:type II toxin-antitoxin system HipA family toxin [Myxococcaceae bacterium]